jgi:hypothetical protein
VIIEIKLMKIPENFMIIYFIIAKKNYVYGVIDFNIQLALFKKMEDLVNGGRIIFSLSSLFSFCMIV